jgi:hypothetical protein
MQLQAGQTGAISFYIFMGSGETPSSAILAAISNARPALPAIAPVDDSVAITPKPEPAPELAPELALERTPKQPEGTYVSPPTPTHDAPFGTYPQIPYPQNAYPATEYPSAYQYVQPVYTAAPDPAAPDPAAPDADLVYAMELFDRIQKLGSGPGGVDGINRDEISRLTRELDGFLARIGKK